ncbi:MAG: hypothetical protein SGCHY_005506 [Lobulomycetales sp.]
MRTLQVSPNPLDWYLNHQKVLRIQYSDDSLTPGRKDLPRGGNAFYAAPLGHAYWQQSNAIEFCYDVFFQRDFDFNLGGKLPGLYGGSPSRCTNPPDCFSTRLMWRRNGEGELYAYLDRNGQGDDYCNAPPYSSCTGGHGDSLGRGSWTFQRERWETLCQVTKLNSPGQRDGSIQISVNGEVRIDMKGLFIRNPGVGFGGIAFHTFFGGSPLHWASPRTQYTYFRNIRVKRLE